MPKKGQGNIRSRNCTMRFGTHAGKTGSMRYNDRSGKIVQRCRVRLNFSGADGGAEEYAEEGFGLPEETGIGVVDDTIAKIVGWEQSHLSNPIIQFALIGFAGYGIVTLVTKIVK